MPSFVFFLIVLTLHFQSLDIYHMIHDLISGPKKLSMVFLDINIVHINNANFLSDILPFISSSQACFILNKNQMRFFNINFFFSNGLGPKQVK